MDDAKLLRFIEGNVRGLEEVFKETQDLTCLSLISEQLVTLEDLSNDGGPDLDYDNLRDIAKRCYEVILKGGDRYNMEDIMTESCERYYRIRSTCKGEIL